MYSSPPPLVLESAGAGCCTSASLCDSAACSVWEPWLVSSNTTVWRDFGPGHMTFSTISAVCYLYGAALSDALGPQIPIGMISDNWGGTKVEVWAPSTVYSQCDRVGANGNMYNSMILPYSEGPMTLSGFLWYQGEANTQNATTAADYGCLFPAMISSWRDAFKAPDLFFGFVQLSTWCALPPASLPQMRDAQMKALALPNVAYATNADHGAGCNIHPPEKQWVAARLANAALALVYKQDVPWRAPTYHTAIQTTVAPGVVGLTVGLADVGAAGLHKRYPYNLRGSFNVDAPSGVANPSTIVDCSSSFPVNATMNASMSLQCAWASLNVAGIGWVNATLTIAGSSKLLLSVHIPSNSEAIMPKVVGSAYGWGPIPMLTVYADGLPVLPWNRTV